MHSDTVRGKSVVSRISNDFVESNVVCIYGDLAVCYRG